MNRLKEQVTGPNISTSELLLAGRETAIIAVIDSGFDLSHPNLNYVAPDLHFNAVEYFARQKDGKRQLRPHLRSHRPYDASRSFLAHGTSVAGAAAAIRRNPREPMIDGVAPGFPVMPLKVGAPPKANEVAAAIYWAADRGARVINMSFKVRNLRSVSLAIDYAWSRNVVICAASGNRRPGYPDLRVDFPARHSKVIAVGAIDLRGRRKRLDHRRGEGDWGSQYGAELDVVAPGLEVRTLDDTGALGVLPGNYLLKSKGTSIASPQVAGLAALLFGIRPELTNQQVRDVIEGTCDRLTGYRFQKVTGRRWSWNKEVGYGRVNIQKTISALDTRQV